MHRSWQCNAVVTASIVWGCALSAHAGDIVVSTFLDTQDGVCDADCSLREAVIQANAGPGRQRILLIPGTYNLTLPAPRGEDGLIFDEDENANGDLDIKGDVEIVAEDAQTTIIDAGYIDRIFEVASGASLTLNKVTLTRGRHSSQGGAIENLGNLTLRHAQLIGNFASYGFGSGRGGGVANFGTMTAHYVLFQRNQSSFGDSGSSRGGAIYNDGQLQVRESTFERNLAFSDDVTGDAGAVFNRGQADIARTTFSNNAADGQGGAIINDGNGVMKLNNSTFSHNSLYTTYFFGVVTNGMTFGASAGTPTLYLTQVTMAENDGAWTLYNRGQLFIRNSLIVASPDEAPCYDATGGSGYRATGLLIGGSQGNCVADLYVDDSTAMTTVLYPLAANNGNTQTYGLRKNSPALDAGNPAACTAADQRGLARPRDGDGDGVAVCDLGAYERARP